MAIYKRASGRWGVLLDLEPTPNGKRRRTSLGTYRTRKDAERAERSAREAVERGHDFSAKTVTVGQLLDSYVSECVALGLAEKTLQEYRAVAARYIRPHLGSIVAAKLRSVRIAAWRDELLARGGKAVKIEDGSMRQGPLEPKTVVHAMSLANSAWRSAKQAGLVFHNPFEGVKRPKVRRSSAAALLPDEIARLLEAARGTRWEGFIAIAISTACRRGELCALSWDDFDAERAELHVRHSLSQTKAGLTLKDPKTHQNRVVPLTRMAVEALSTQRVQQAKDRLAAGALYELAKNDCQNVRCTSVHKPIFTDEIGRRITPMTATCAFERIARKAKISTSRLHDLRHTGASLLLRAGIDVATVAAVLGHESAVVTLRVYSHQMPGAKREAIDVLGSALDRMGSAKRS